MNLGLLTSHPMRAYSSTGLSVTLGREGPREGSEQRSEDPSTGNFSLASGHGRGGFEVIRSRPETPNVLHLPFCMFSL